MARRSPLNHHDVSPFLQSLRDLLLGRKHVRASRFTDIIAERTQPPPNIPGGCNHKLADNYYCTRDGRRLVEQPQILFDATKSRKMLPAESTKKSKAVTVTEKQPKTPGSLYMPILRQSL